ncbi:MAG: hypothetical protein QOK49_4104, partial [Baekduia sp.]|nr:hypothetical protein [Baekduia sp.]
MWASARARIGALTAAALLWSATPAGAVPADPGRASTGDPRDAIARMPRPVVIHVTQT